MAEPDLWARIMSALEGEGVDADEFETAALVLLKDSYPTLSPVTGGTDLGRDADVPKADQVIRLLATTAQAPVANLRNGLRRMEEEGLPFEDVVLATSQPVSATRRRELEEIVADEFGARLVMVYDRSWLAGELYRDAHWRQRLLGVTGEPPALTPVPLSASRSHLPTVDLVGRDEELAQLGSSRQDVIVVGASGLGKTRLVAELPDGVFVELHGETARIADDIRRIEPSSVIVDDAHEHTDTLQLLQSIREAGPPSFQILATTWPETTDAVSDALSGAKEIALAPLERGDAAKILTELGVTNRILVGDILDQSEGRPGWILLLGDLARQGQGEQILTGGALIDQIGRLARRLARGPIAMSLLAQMAAFEPLTAKELQQLAAELRISQPEATEAVSILAEHGLTEWRRDRWTVRPTRLQAALVANHFFSRPPKGDIDTLLGAWPTARLRLSRGVVLAGLVGSADAARKARLLVPDLAQNMDLLASDAGDLLRLYALTSRQAASWIIDYIDQQQPTSPAGDTSERADASDPADRYTVQARWDRAVEAVEAAAKRHALPKAFELLADMALRDTDRTERSGHPRRRLLELATTIGPYGGTDRRLRQQSLECAQHLALSDDTAAVELAAELAAAAMSPVGSGSWLDPVDRNSITWADRLEDLQQLEWIADELWPIWQDLVVDLDDGAVASTLELVGAWQRVATGGDARLSPPESTQTIAERHALQMLRSFRERCERSPGLAIRWNEQLGQLRGDSSDLERIEVDDGFSALVPDLELPLRERDTERRQRIDILAERLAEHDVDEVVGQLADWRQSAEVAGRHIGLSARHLLEELGIRGRPTDLLVAVLTSESLWQDAHQLAATALQMEPERWADWIPDVLADHTRRPLALAVVLGQPLTPRPVTATVVADLAAADAWQLETILFKRGVADEVVHSLLTHEVEAIRAATALVFKLGSMQHGLDLPEAWRDEWVDAFLDVPPQTKSHHRWRFEGLVKALADVDPEVPTTWFEDALEDTVWSIDHDDIELVAHLPRGHRRRVLKAATQHPSRRWLICAAVGHDADFVTDLLDDAVIDVGEAVVCITREQRGSWFENVAPELVRRGADPKEVAGHLVFGTGWGEESVLYESLADYMAELAGSDDAELAKIGRASEQGFRAAARKAAETERQRRIRGL